MIDRTLMEYLASGKAWVLVGSGPSIQMRYPSWASLAQATFKWVSQEVHGIDLRGVQWALQEKDWPLVFEAACRFVDEGRLLEFLRDQLKPAGSPEIYDHICRWPVPVFLTTNWDDEVQKGLGRLRDTYVPYSNNRDHMALLVPDFRGGIVKLHGDLRSFDGLVLTKGQYDAIESGSAWEHWRAKMSAVFQMQKVVIVGHSLDDPHLRHVLKAASAGSSVNQPVCWIAPDVSIDQSREYLRNHRIHVVSYENRDGTHHNLLRLLESVSRILPARESVHVRAEIAQQIPGQSESERSSAAALFVFNRMAANDPDDAKRVRLVTASLQAAVPDLAGRNAPFTLQEALNEAGWPGDVPVSQPFETQLSAEVIADGLLSAV